MAIANDDIPLLIIAFNRPEKLIQLLHSLRESEPPLILLAVDGPRPDNPNDLALVRETQEALKFITWNCKIETRFRETNMGLRRAYVDAVNWAISQYGRSVVVEDDVVAGPQFYEYVSRMLRRYSDEFKISQINGYNHIPARCLADNSRGSRLTRYPTSYAWGTWDRAWKNYDPELKWGLEIPIGKLAEITESKIAALRWKANFLNAYSGRVDTWDYFWVASIWQNNQLVVSPNRNLVQYNGFEDGTHTRRKRKNTQPPIETLEYDDNNVLGAYSKQDDFWISKHVFNDTTIGLMETAAASLILEFSRMFKNLNLR
jgi:glycosyltransferase involved in cell wall biosynthesis